MSTQQTGLPRSARVGGGTVALGASIPFFLVLLATTGIVTDIQGVALLPLVGTMVADIGLTGAQTSWALNALGLASAVVLGLSARYADIVGHRRVLIPLMLLGVVGSIVCALASSFVMLVIGRALTGMAISAPMAWAMLKIRGDARTMQTAALMNGTVISIMTPIALIMGGLMLEAGTSWTAVFWIIAAGYVVLLGLTLVAEETPRAVRTKVRLDWIGSIGLGVWLICLLLAISNGESWGWGSTAVIALFAAGVISLLAWIVQQRRTTEALLDFRDMDTRQVFSGYFSYCGVAALASGMYLIVPALAQTPSEVGYGFGSSVLESSLTLLPILPGTFLASAISRHMLPRVGPRPPMVLGGVLCVCAYLWYALAHDALWQMYVGTALYGVGIVICFNIGWALVAAAGRQDNMSITFGIQYALALPVGALMTAIMIVVMNANHIAGTPVPVEGGFTVDFYILAGVAAATLVANGLFAVPRVLTHHGEDAPVGPGTDALEGLEGTGSASLPLTRADS
ncbi:MFS transporter [Conexibacter sp. JD483]|uniref:MFS transporter n=1 Tax=unclassified Conexibacter TaxID=2627773 RepID=UPI00271861B4|nr:MULTISPECIES: MFS transporter [unclassified Conexibacter]MDO8187950.1 MFS transporter [Conexibacter sp. CPCC 205706]MDO8200181.1 MFS transporter [Conexibacter sp. CPCC 205762]MDR9369727.1 MFS transporter [Conexibacter sp. JD483]